MDPNPTKRMNTGTRISSEMGITEYILDGVTPPDDGVGQLAGLLRWDRLEAEGGTVAETLRYNIHHSSPHAGRTPSLAVTNIFYNHEYKAPVVARKEKVLRIRIKIIRIRFRFQNLGSFTKP